MTLTGKHVKQFQSELSCGWDLCLVPGGSLMVPGGVTLGTKVPGCLCSSHPSFLTFFRPSFLPLSLPYLLCSIFPSSPPSMVPILLAPPVASPRCCCQCPSALQTSFTWCCATSTGGPPRWWAGCQSWRTTGASTVVTVSAGGGTSSSHFLFVCSCYVEPGSPVKKLHSNFAPLLPHQLFVLSHWLPVM